MIKKAIIITLGIVLAILGNLTPIYGEEGKFDYYSTISKNDCSHKVENVSTSQEKFVNIEEKCQKRNDIVNNRVNNINYKDYQQNNHMKNNGCIKSGQYNMNLVKNSAGEPIKKVKKLSNKVINNEVINNEGKYQDHVLVINTSKHNVEVKDSKNITNITSERKSNGKIEYNNQIEKVVRKTNNNINIQFLNNKGENNEGQNQEQVNDKYQIPKGINDKMVNNKDICGNNEADNQKRGYEPQRVTPENDINLPTTGEEHNHFLMIIGGIIILMGISSFAYMYKFKPSCSSFES